MTPFTESTIEQAAIDWEETLKVFTVNFRHVGRESLAKRGARSARETFRVYSCLSLAKVIIKAR
jgi:hypothetical protein